MRLSTGTRLTRIADSAIARTIAHGCSRTTRLANAADILNPTGQRQGERGRLPLVAAKSAGVDTCDARGGEARPVRERRRRARLDQFLLPQFVTILEQTGPLGAPSVIARVPVRGPALTGTNLRLAAGSVWLAARVQAVEADEAELRELE